MNSVVESKKMTGLFAVPVGSYQMPRSFTPQELNHFKSLQANRLKNSSNWIGSDTMVLDHEPMADLKKLVLTCVDDYITTINGVHPPGVETYLVASWLNWARKGESHLNHTHSNCLFSGTLYIDVDENTDAVVFNRHRVEALSIFEFDKKELTEWNKKEHKMPVRKGMINVFPAMTMHYVPPVTGNHLRVSLGFNAFIRGTICTKVSSTLTI